MKKDTEDKGRILDIFRSKYALSFLKKYLVYYIFGIVILIGIDLLQTEVPLIVGGSIDSIAANEFTGNIVTTQLVRLIVIGILVFAGRIAWRWFIFGAARKIERDMRNGLYEHLQLLSASYFQEHKAGEIMAYMTSDIESVRMVFAMCVVMGMDALALGISTLYKMITQIDTALTIVSFIPLILVALTAAIMGGELHRRYTRRQEAYSQMSDFVQEKLNGIRVVKAFRQEEAENEAFEKENANTRTANVKEAKLEAFMFPFMRMVAGLSMAIAIAYGGYIAIIGRISVGDFSGFLMFLNMLVWPMACIGRIINLLTRGSASLKRLAGILDAAPDIYDWPESKEADSSKPVSGSIEFKNLSFSYPGSESPVFNNVSFTLEKGQTLGIIGRTGEGKTTLVNLLLRVFEPGKDMIYIGGRELHSIPLHTLRKTVAYVPQDTFLFSDTISANIAFGDRSKTQEEIQHAAELACVHDNIADFPDGYNTMVGERGVSLSGGQKQRIAIARALILDPEILVLDDSVSAVDTDTEEKILMHLKQERKGKTNIIIAHRISTLQNADKIIVLSEGKIAEEGTHQELLAVNGIYADMYRRQLLEKIKKEEYGYDE